MHYVSIVYIAPASACELARSRRCFPEVAATAQDGKRAVESQLAASKARVWEAENQVAESVMALALTVLNLVYFTAFRSEHRSNRCCPGGGERSRS